MEPVKRLGVLLAVGAALLLAGGWLGMPAAQAQERCWDEHITDPPQDFSRLRRVCEGDIPPTPGPGPHPQPTPPPCPNPTEIIVSGPHRDENRGVCYVIVQVIDLCTNTPQGDPFTREVECPRSTASNPCVDPNGNPLFAIGPDGIFCGRDGGRWRVEARVRFPPYPATLVGWPTAIRLSELGRAAGEGTLGYVPLGGGKPEDPKPGDWRNVRLRLELVPVGFCRITLPQARGPMTVLQRPRNPLPLHTDFWLEARGVTGRPLYLYWEVPSHPAAGNTFLDPGLNARVGLPGDFPAFRGSVRAPYILKWTFEWEEYKEETNKYCDDKSPAGDECDSNGDGIKDKKWRWETRRWWEAKSEGGVVDPDAIRGLPPLYRADLNGDGKADALWNYNSVIRRMNESDRPATGSLAFEMGTGGVFPFWVREAQGQIGWPSR
jgi:hypothetical protein